jgi:phosphoglycolate phosphatase
LGESARPDLAAGGLPSGYAALTPQQIADYVAALKAAGLASAGFDTATAARALDIYRPLYSANGVYDATVYPGLPGVLRAIHQAGLPLSLATSKPETPARMVLDHFELSRWIDELTGASDDEVRSAKADVVAEALRRLAENGADLSRPVMVGDRSHDIHGAAEHDVPTVFVTWGYGAPEEQAGAVASASDSGDLLQVLGLGL